MGRKLPLSADGRKIINKRLAEGSSAIEIVKELLKKQCISYILYVESRVAKAKACSHL